MCEDQASVLNISNSNYKYSCINVISKLIFHYKEASKFIRYFLCNVTTVANCIVLHPTIQIKIGAILWYLESLMLKTFYYVCNLKKKSKLHSCQKFN